MPVPKLIFAADHRRRQVQARQPLYRGAERVIESIRTAKVTFEDVQGEEYSFPNVHCSIDSSGRLAVHALREAGIPNPFAQVAAKDSSSLGDNYLRDYDLGMNVPRRW